jgi:hypothetical protein
MNFFFNKRLYIFGCEKDKTNKNHMFHSMGMQKEEKEKCNI